MTIRFLKEDIKRVLLRKTTWFSILFFALIVVVNVMFIRSELPLSNPNYEPFSAFEYFISIQGGMSGFVHLILPLVVTVTVGDFFISERLSSMLSYSLTRSDTVKSFIQNRMISLGITSFLSTLVVQLFILIGLLILFPVTKPSIDQGIVYYAVGLFESNPLIYSLIIIINSALMACFFSFFSLMISLYAKNFYAAILLPYVIFIGASEILMTLPLLIGEVGLFFYNIAPLNMGGDYITNSFHWLTVPLYWIGLSAISIKLIPILAQNRFKKEKLIIN